jgi:hypothetical protein
VWRPDPDVRVLAKYYFDKLLVVASSNDSQFYRQDCDIAQAWLAATRLLLTIRQLPLSDS